MYFYCKAVLFSLIFVPQVGHGASVSVFGESGYLHFWNFTFDPSEPSFLEIRVERGDLATQEALVHNFTNWTEVDDDFHFYLTRNNQTGETLRACGLGYDPFYLVCGETKLQRFEGDIIHKWQLICDTKYGQHCSISVTLAKLEDFYGDSPVITVFFCLVLLFFIGVCCRFFLRYLESLLFTWLIKPPQREEKTD